MEQIQSHEIKDIFRIKQGVILEVHKYRRKPNTSYVHSIDSKKTKIVRGCKGLKVLKEEHSDKYGGVQPIGTYIYGSLLVEPETDVNNFKFEVKTSGGSIYGSDKEIIETLETINNIIKRY